MKTSSNKFDYPTAASHTYKKYRQEIDQESNQHVANNKKQHKQRYQQVNQEQRNNQRARVKLEQERKKDIERENHVRKIEAEIQNKKKQLLQLEEAKIMAIQAQSKSYQLALIRQEQQKNNEIDKQTRQRENQAHAQNRFVYALKRLEAQKDVANKKNKQALLRRKVAQNTEKIERQKAIAYRQIVEQKQRNEQPQQKRSFKDYKQPLGRTAYKKGIDYTTSHMHNPLIIIPNKQILQEQGAVSKAQERNQLQAKIQRKRIQSSEQNKRRSMERGQIAIGQIRLKQEYAKYREEQEANAIKYNLDRIEAGKRNQYVGLKPATVAQMELQKKIRREEQFEKMFFGQTNPEVYSQPASQYTILQARLGNTDIATEPVALCRGNPRSNEGVISDGHYSFESGEDIEELTTVKKHEHQQLQGDKQHNQSLNAVKEYDRRREGNNYASKESRNRQELNYSESEDDEDDQN